MSFRGYINKNRYIKGAAKIVLTFTLIFIFTAFLATLLPAKNANATEQEVPAWQMPPGIKDAGMGFGLFTINEVTQVCALHTNFLAEDGRQIGSCSDFAMVIAGMNTEAMQYGQMPPQTLQEAGVYIYIQWDQTFPTNSSICAIHPETADDGEFIGNCVPLIDLLDSEPYVFNIPKWDLKPGEGSPDGTEFSI